MKKTMKKLVALCLAMVMILAMGLTSFAAENDASTITVNVAIKTTGLNGGTIKSDTVTLNSGATALDALKALYPNATLSSQTENISINGTLTPTTCYYYGDLKWYMSSYGNYIPAVKVQGHSNSNKYFDTEGTAGSDDIASGEDYFKLDALTNTETTTMGLTAGATWNDTVKADNFVTEKDYNDYSGWMVTINGNSPYYGIDTVLAANDVVVLDFSMMMGLDIGLDSYVPDANGNWTYVPAWN